MARCALLLAITLLLGTPIAAQDALPETPRELRDFRLDPENAQPEPQVTPPPVVPTLPETRPAAPSSQQPAPQRTQRPAPADEAPARPALETVEPVPAPNETGPAQDVLPAPVEALPGAPDTSAAAPNDAQSASMPWWQMGAGLAAALLALFGFFAFRRRQSVRDDQPAFEPAIGPDRVSEMPQAPASFVPPVRLATPPPSPVTPADVELQFVPDKATLSFTSLTVKGQLRVINKGEVPAQNLRLRATLLSANAQQQQFVAAFHAGQITVPEEPLGEAKPGESIALQIEIAVPVAELKSFEVDNKRIVVPLFVADLAYESVGRADKAKIACLVGKETQPPAQKMAPFRLDLGPRSFAPLGQRPLYA